MSKTDFQNGFALGLASKGKVIQKTIHADSSISIPIIESVGASVVINSMKIIADSSAKEG